MKKILFFIIAIALLLSSCDLYETPQDEVGKDAIFGSETGLETYAYSFYNMLPSASSLNSIDVELVDNGARNAYENFITLNAYSEESSSGWDWDDLRNVNYFIVNCTNESVDEDIRNNYIGIAKVFRAYFYFEMVKKFGDVPWIDEPLDIDDEDELYGERDSRELVMENVYEDLEFACENITDEDASGSLVTKWVAYALASRIALFEGTFRKYHNLSLSTSADTWLQRAVDMSKYIIENSGYEIYTGDGTEESYRALFTSDDPITDEVIMAACCSEDLGVMHNANWKYTSSTYGNRFNFTRTFINTFLQLDGTSYTTRDGWETEGFYDECQDRDCRLAQTIRTPGYTRDGENTAPNFGGYTFTGYQPIKLCLDGTEYDSGTLNTNSLPYFRYAEVLLNYAEAKAELGTITDDDWAQTIGTIRSRAGITGGLSSLPTTVDSYFQTNYFSDISEPVILEIRRERAVELSLEGFRFDDLRRWNCGDLLLQSWYGMYVPKLNSPMDLDRDGTYDVIFYTSDDGLEAAKELTGDWATASSTCATVYVEEGEGSSSQLQLIEKVDGADGYYLTWDKPNEEERVWGDKQYLYPIPASVMVKNSNIIQNSGWEDGATNNGD